MPPKPAPAENIALSYAKVALILEARRAIKLNPFLIEFLGNTDHPVHRDQHNPKGKFCGGASSDGAKAA
jgi:hypothetical protein